MLEIYEKDGDTTIPTTINNQFKKSGVHYVTLSVENHADMILRACSLRIDDNAYFIPIPGDIGDDCNILKTNSRFYHRIGGILAKGRPCGYIVGVSV